MEHVTPDQWPDEGNEEISDEELYKQFCVEGDREAFTVLIRRFDHELHVHLRKYTPNVEIADDAFQETCLKLFNKAQYFKEGMKLRPWLYSIATRTAIDCNRRNKRFRHLSLQVVTPYEDGFEYEPEDSFPGPVERSEIKEACEWIQSEIEKLTQDIRAVVQLVMFEGYKNREAAEILGISLGAVKSRLHRVIKNIRSDHPSKLAG